jgi:hypothetical protein
MQHVFHSTEFAHGLTRLFEDQIAREHNYQAWANVPSAGSVATLLRKYQLEFVPGILTKLQLADGRDVTRAPSEGADFNKSLVFVNGLKIHVSTVKSPLRIQLLMAHVVNKLLQTDIPSLERLSNLSPIAAMFELQSPSKIHALLVNSYLLNHALPREFPRTFSKSIVLITRRCVGDWWDSNLLQKTKN